LNKKKKNQTDVLPGKAAKIVVIGCGSVGSTYIYAIMQTGLAREIVIIDVDKKRLEGEVLDLSHGLFFVPPVIIRSGDYPDCAGADLIVVTAGAKQSAGQSRLELVRRNAEIVSSICKNIKAVDTNAVLVMVTNPVDILTCMALKQLDWPKHRIIGSGTVLDSARFRYMLSRHCGIDTRNVHAYILGEHGDSEVPAWSMTHLAGVPIKQYCSSCLGCDSDKTHQQITRQVRDSAYHIIDYKGSTYYAIGLSLVRISAAIMRNEHSVLTVSAFLDGEYNITDVCLSVPCVIGSSGIERIITAPLSPAEQSDLEKSAHALREVLSTLKS
jgi:L-lactate dehydrogenase